MNQTSKKSSKTKIDWDLFEYVVIYNALTDETYLASIIDIVDPHYFTNKSISLIFNIVKEYYSKNNSVPNITEIKLRLTSEEQKNAFKLVVNKFSDLDKKYNHTELLLNTERFFRERAVQHALLDTAKDFSEKEIDASIVYNTFEKACNISLVDNLGRDYFNDIDEHVNDLKKTNSFISTGWEWLDKRIGGGFIEDGRSLYIVSGATNSGKSIVLGNIAANLIANNKTVIVISLEMSEVVYSKRISSQLSQIPMGRIANQTDDLKKFVSSYRSTRPQSRLFIKEYAPKSVTVNHIKSYIKTLMGKKNIKPEAIIIDYVNLIQPTIVTGHSYTDVKLVSEQLRALSYEFLCPVISATQINRDGYDKANPGLEKTSESMGLTHTADVMFAVWSNEKDKDIGVIHFGLQKNRYGPNFGTKAMHIDYDTLIIHETTDDVVNNEEVNSADNTIKNLLGDTLGSDNFLNSLK